MKKIILILIFCFFGSCKTSTVITAPSSEIAVTATAIRDSFDSARIDLADNYSNALTQLIIPPSKRIQIEPIYKNGKRVAIIPDKYREDNVVIVGTNDWNDLVKIKEVVTQLNADKTNLHTQILNIREELNKQQEIKEKLAADNNTLQIQIKDVKSSNFKLHVYLWGMVLVILSYLYFKLKPL